MTMLRQPMWEWREHRGRKLRQQLGLARYRCKKLRQQLSLKLGLERGKKVCLQLGLAIGLERRKKICLQLGHALGLEHSYDDAKDILDQGKKLLPIKFSNVRKYTYYTPKKKDQQNVPK